MYSANWKAKTAVCLVIPTRSPSGAMMGMVRAACAVPEWTKKLIAHWDRPFFSTRRYSPPGSSQAAATARTTKA
jgi:hypothetical protein